MKTKIMLSPQDMTNSDGVKWEVGRWYEAAPYNHEDSRCEGMDNYYPFFDSPEISDLTDTNVDQVQNPRYWECEIDGDIHYTGIRGHAERIRLIREITDYKTMTIEKGMEIAIRLTMEICKEPSFTEWAENWVSGRDKSRESAWTAKLAAEKIWTGWRQKIREKFSLESLNSMHIAWTAKGVAEAASWPMDQDSVAMIIAQVVEYVASAMSEKGISVTEKIRNFGSMVGPDNI